MKGPAKRVSMGGEVCSSSLCRCYTSCFGDTTSSPFRTDVSFQYTRQTFLTRYRPQRSPLKNLQSVDSTSTAVSWRGSTSESESVKEAERSADSSKSRQLERVDEDEVFAASKVVFAFNSSSAMIHQY